MHRANFIFVLACAFGISFAGGARRRQHLETNCDFLEVRFLPVQVLKATGLPWNEHQVIYYQRTDEIDRNDQLGSECVQNAP